MNDSPRTGSLLVIFLTVFIDLLGFAIVLPLLPIYARQFTVDETGWQLGVLMASFSVMQFLFAPVWGRLSDRVGRRPVLMLGLGASVVFYTLFGVATTMKSLGLVFLSRIGAGIAGATIPTAQAYIADSTTLETRPKGMALIGMAFGMGFTFGPVLGYLAAPSRDADPGPWPGYVAAGLSAVALLLAIFLLPESKREDSESAARKLFDMQALREAVRVPSVGLLLVALFICVFSFAGFETTLSMLINSSERLETPFGFSWRQVCLTFAFIGITLAVIQGGIVRRLAGKVPEGVMALTGALIDAVGFCFVAAAVYWGSVPALLLSLVVVVMGFSFMQPNINSLLSRRSDPHKQGMILGLGQSVNALARIFGSLIGIPLLVYDLTLPYLSAALFIGLGGILIWTASRRGSDFAAPDSNDDGPEEDGSAMGADAPQSES